MDAALLARLEKDARIVGDRITLSDARGYVINGGWVTVDGEETEVELAYSPKANVERLLLVAEVIDALVSASNEVELRDAVARLDPDDAEAVRRLAATKEARKAYVEKQPWLRRVVDASGLVGFEHGGFLPVYPDVGTRADEVERRAQRFAQDIVQLVAKGLSERAARKKWFDDETTRRLGRARRSKEYPDALWEDMRENKVCAPIYARERAEKRAITKAN